MRRLTPILLLVALAVSVAGCYYGPPGYGYGPVYYHHPHYYWYR